MELDAPALFDPVVVVVDGDAVASRWHSDGGPVPTTVRAVREAGVVRMTIARASDGFELFSQVWVDHNPGSRMTLHWREDV